MAMSQMQIIQSLGEAMSWYQREREWGVQPAELRHLCGRIGELYTALITNGQLALKTNQQGYDVVSKDGEKISVKTTTMTHGAGHVSFNPNTLDLVDRVVVLRINDEEMQVETLLDTSVSSARELMWEGKSKLNIPLSKLNKKIEIKSPINISKMSKYGDLTITELESGTIEVFRGELKITPTRPKLTKIAESLGIPIINSNGNKYNTRQLGSLIIDSISKRQ